MGVDGRHGGGKGEVEMNGGGVQVEVQVAEMERKPSSGEPWTSLEGKEPGMTLEDLTVAGGMLGLRLGGTGVQCLGMEAVGMWSCVSGRDVMGNCVSDEVAGLTVVSSAVSSADTMEDRVEDRVADAGREMDTGTVSGKYTNASQVLKDGTVAADEPVASVVEKIA